MARDPSPRGIEVVDLIPKELGDREGTLARLRKLTRGLDSLPALDEQGELIVDRDGLQRIVEDDELFPSDVRQPVRVELEARLEGRVKPRADGRALGWYDLAEYQDPIQPVPPTDLRDVGIVADASVDEVRRVLKERYAGVPDFWLQADATAVDEAVRKALTSNQSVWDCCVRHLGFWVALAVFAAAGAALIVGTATGPWGIPLAIWLISVLGGGTAVIVLTCLRNPYS